MKKIRLNEFHEQVKLDLASLEVTSQCRGQILRKRKVREIVEDLTLEALAFSGREDQIDQMKSGTADRDFELEYLRIRETIESLVVSIVGSGQKIQYNMKGSLDTGYISKIEM
jgi:hypothetical protein